MPHSKPSKLSRLLAILKLSGEKPAASEDSEELLTVKAMKAQFELAVVGGLRAQTDDWEGLATWLQEAHQINFTKKQQTLSRRIATG